MMKIQFTPKDFLRLFKLTASAAAARDIKPVLQHVKIVADKNVGAILTATDIDMGIRVRLDVDVIEEGVALLPIKTLRTILDSTKETTLTMESVMTNDSEWESIGNAPSDAPSGDDADAPSDDDTDNIAESESTDDDDDSEYVRYTPQRRRTCSVVLFGQHERHELLTQDPDEFPNVEAFNLESYHELEADDMKTLIQRTAFAVDTDNIRYALGGVCFEGKDGHDVITTVATDGRRLAVQTTSRYFSNGTPAIGKSRNKTCSDGTEQEHIDYPIVGTPALTLLMKVLTDKAFKKQKRQVYGSTVKMAFDSCRVLFHCESAQGNEQITIFSRLLEGKFPKWRGIIPDKEKPMACAEVNSDTLLAAVKNVQGIATDLEPGIFVTFENGQMTLEGRVKEKGSTKTSIAADCKGKATIKIDPSFLTGMLKTLNGTSVTIHCNGDNPLLIETDGENYTYVAMPMSGEQNAPSPNQAWDENGIDLQAEAKAKAQQKREEEEGKREVETAIEDVDIDEDEDESETGDVETESETELHNVPIDENRYVTWEYFHKSIVETVYGTDRWAEHKAFTIDRPRFLPEWGKFVAVGLSGNDDDPVNTRQHVFVEWVCEPDSRTLVATTDDDYPDWATPTCVVPINESDDTGYEVDDEYKPEIPIDEEGYMATPGKDWDDVIPGYCNSTAVHVVIAEDGTEYSLERPRYIPAENLFRAAGISNDRQTEQKRNRRVLMTSPVRRRCNHWRSPTWRKLCPDRQTSRWRCRN